MDSNKKSDDSKSIDRRNFMKMGAAGAALVGAPGMYSAFSQTANQDTKDPWTNSNSKNRLFHPFSMCYLLCRCLNYSVFL